MVWLCTPIVGKEKPKKLYCPWNGSYKVAKKLSDQVDRIQHTQNRNQHQQQSSRQDTALEKSIPVLPEIVLHLVDQDDDMPELNSVPITLNNQADNSVQQSTDRTRHRYSHRENRQRPLQYQDD